MEIHPYTYTLENMEQLQPQPEGDKRLDDIKVMVKPIQFDIV